MIKSFAHKGLREFYESGSKKGIQPEHAPKRDSGTGREGIVCDNWKKCGFYFEGQDAYLVDYQDYH